ncbi:MAG: hypothetical protein WEE89_01880 [Gemmatimonadota bacterium]
MRKIEVMGAVLFAGLLLPVAGKAVPARRRAAPPPYRVADQK